MFTYTVRRKIALNQFKIPREAFDPLNGEHKIPAQQNSFYKFFREKCNTETVLDFNKY